MTVTLAQLIEQTALDVLDHLERQVAIPVLAGLQAQGDLIVIPLGVLVDANLAADASWHDVPATGIELLRSAGGGNPHTLVSDAGACEWTTDVRDQQLLATGALRTTQSAHLIHPEHGGSGIAPGTYFIRRQRERANQRGSNNAGSQLIAD